MSGRGLAGLVAVFGWGLAGACHAGAGAVRGEEATSLGSEVATEVESEFDVESETESEVAPESEVATESEVESEVAPDTASDTSADTTVGPDTTAPPACLGPSEPLRLAAALPFVDVTLGASHGAFLLDWATTASVIDPSGFAVPRPAPVPGTATQWDGFDFFGAWGRVTLAPQDLSFFTGPFPEAGIIGTDFLSLNAFTLDWPRARVYRAATGALCDDATLRALGLRPLSAAGHFARNLADLDPNTPNVPTVPIRIGPATAPAQLDTGFDDHLVPGSVNVNRAFFDAITAGLALVRAPSRDVTLTTCVPGVSESVQAYRLPAGATLAFIGTDGAVVTTLADPTVYLKATPAAAQVCGGIGTSQVPAAQLGITALAFGPGAGRIVFDPETSRVWLPATAP